MPAAHPTGNRPTRPGPLRPPPVARVVRVRRPTRPGCPSRGCALRSHRPSSHRVLTMHRTSASKPNAPQSQANNRSRRSVCAICSCILTTRTSGKLASRSRTAARTPSSTCMGGTEVRTTTVALSLLRRDGHIDHVGLFREPGVARAGGDADHFVPFLLHLQDRTRRGVAQLPRQIFTHHRYGRHCGEVSRRERTSGNDRHAQGWQIAWSHEIHRGRDVVRRSGRPVIVEVAATRHGPHARQTGLHQARHLAEMRFQPQIEGAQALVAVA